VTWSVINIRNFPSILDRHRWPGRYRSLYWLSPSAISPTLR